MGKKNVKCGLSGWFAGWVAGDGTLALLCIHEWPPMFSPSAILL